MITSNPFIPLSEPAFCDLFDECPDKAVAYIHRAREASEIEAGQSATQLLVYCLTDLVRSKVAKLISEPVNSYRVEEVADEVVLQAVKSVLSNPPELVNRVQLRGWLNAIAENHVFGETRLGRDKIRRNSISLTPYLTPYAGDDYRPVVLPAVYERGYDALADRELILVQIAKLPRKEHKLAVHLRLLRDQTSKQVVNTLAHCGMVMTATNVDKITSRFRAALRAETVADDIHDYDLDA